MFRRERKIPFNYHILVQYTIAVGVILLSHLFLKVAKENVMLDEEKHN